MSQEYLEKFAEKIAPYRELWKSVRVTCLAVQQGSVWLSLAVRVLLRELASAQPTTISPVPDFVASRVDYPVTSFDYILRSLLLEGFVPLQTDSGELKAYLSRFQAGLPGVSAPTISWFGVYTNRMPATVREYGTNRTCISLSALGDRPYEILSRDRLDKIDSKLRLEEPAYDGLDALASELMPGVKLRASNQSPIEVVAPLPFDLEYAEPGGLIVRAPLAAGNGTLIVKCFFRPKGRISSQIVEAQGASECAETGTLRWESPVEWPKESEQAKIMLFFRQQEVSSIEVNRWPGSGNLRVAVDAYFDPGHKRLREFLLGREGKETQNFEMGVVRLFNLLGIPLVWYGKGAVQGRPDVAAGLLVEDQTKVVVMGECTRERPSAKFSGLAERARELRDVLAGEAEVLPVVFTRATTTESETQQAAEHRVSLVGRKELETLLGLLETAAKTGDVVHFLRTLRPANFPGLIWR